MLAASRRCQNAMVLARRSNLPVTIAIRSFIDMTPGTELRCFIFANELTAISANGDALTDIPESCIIARSRDLLRRALAIDILPFEDCIMDVWLHETDPATDIIVEFNSFGIWSHGSSGLFSWDQDRELLTNSSQVDVRLN